MPPSEHEVFAEMVGAAQAVLNRDAEWSPSGKLNDCNCINLSRKAEQEYEAGRCPHQRLRAALSRAQALPDPGAPPATTGYAQVVGPSWKDAFDEGYKDGREDWVLGHFNVRAAWEASKTLAAIRAADLEPASAADKAATGPDLSTLRRLMEEGTPGPWMEDEAGIVAPGWLVAAMCAPDEYFGEELPDDIQAQVTANAALIVEMHRVCSELLARENGEGV